MILWDSTATSPHAQPLKSQLGPLLIHPFPSGKSETITLPVGCLWNEKKSWASTVTAKAAQAVFLCLLHNLMVLFETGLAETGIPNAAEEKRRKKVLTERSQRVEKAGRIMPCIIAGFQRLTQRTVKFVRWLRSFFWQNRPLDELRLILKKRYAAL
jgi:hypothetical protein